MTARLLTGLLIPADIGRPVSLQSVADSAAAISDAIGGHLLDDTLTVAFPGEVVAGFYMAEDRTGLADNPRFAVLTARLGLHERRFQQGLRGDVLILGCEDDLRDADVAPAVLQVCAQCGIDVRILPAPLTTSAAVPTGHVPKLR